VTIEAVIFDMDGTLLDSTRTVPPAYAAAIYELSGVRCTDEQVIAEYEVGPAAALLSRFIGRDAVDADVDCWLRHLASRASMTVIYPGVRGALEQLSSAGIQLGVFTGATRQAAQLQLDHADLASWFNVVVGSDEIDAVKPAPDGIYRACELLNVDPRNAAYVGDATNDLRCAHAAGAIPVAAAWGHLYEPDPSVQFVANGPAHLIEVLGL